ncbi:MAG: DUF1549 domain-containing protein [Planctomycetaceae bacterium]|nr:DUF1549 domain-containing protein [Planctomycetaceae bacterium]
MQLNAAFHRVLRLAAVRSLAALLVCSAGIRTTTADELAPPAKASSIDFAHDVVPLLQKRCAKCHAGTQHKAGFSINSRHSLIKGGDDGPAVVPGESAASELIERITSDDANFRMPPEGERLTDAQISLLTRWIDAGLPWDDGFAFGKQSRQAPLAPRQPPIPGDPAAAKFTNPIDRFLQGYFNGHLLTSDDLASEQEYARRVSFDLIGLPPSLAELAALAADRSPDQRSKFVDRLLANQADYTAHWLTLWNDLLRNAYHGTGFIDGGRRQISGWLYAAIYENRPYDQFVRELVNPASGVGSEGFIYGIKWRGTVNESQRREIQAAQSVAQVFLATNLKCASCHDSFVNHWKLSDAYALASVFADAPLELHRCDQPIGAPSTVGFLYPELGTIEPQADRAERQRQLAELLTNPGNGRLARTIVNRLWAKLLGRGLVEPLDNLDAQAWHQDLLDFLATDLVAHGYDLKHTLRLIATSRAYQLPGVAADREASREAFVFRGPLVKRLSAEQFVDSVLTLTDAWPAADPAGMTIDGRGQGGQLGAIAQALASSKQQIPTIDRPWLSTAKWVWSSADARAAAIPETIFLRRTFTLDARPQRAIATFTADNSFELFINGDSIAKSENWGAPVQIDVTAALIKGPNIIGVQARNGGDSPNPAGVIGEIVLLDSAGKTVDSLTTDATWRTAGNAPDGWLEIKFDVSKWNAAIVLGDSSVGPWTIDKRLADGAAVSQATVQLPAGFRVRASLQPLDALQAALGRPNREQTVSTRDAAPTMLQALELTNGKLLGQLLQRGAAHWQAQAKSDRDTLIDRIYQTALGRLPSTAERALAADLLGTAPDVENFEDLLWTICMLPEFQLVP